MIAEIVGDFAHAFLTHRFAGFFFTLFALNAIAFDRVIAKHRQGIGDIDHFADRCAGFDFNLQLTTGQALILRGPNGSGKTTLLRALADLQPPADGKITCAPDSIAYAAHSDGLKQMLTVRENLEFWASVFGAGTIDAAIDAFFLEPLLNRMAGALSAGQKRRLGLARLLVTGRPIWVLDEPTVSLDVEAVARFGETIKAHLANGGSALIATHNLDLAARMDRQIRLETGQIVPA